MGEAGYRSRCSVNVSRVTHGRLAMLDAVLYGYMIVYTVMFYIQSVCVCSSDLIAKDVDGLLLTTAAPGTNASAGR